MKKNWLVLVGALLVIGLLAVPQVALAHSTLAVGDYIIEYGWMNEPAVAGQPNAVVINILPKSVTQTPLPSSKTPLTGTLSQNVDISGLKVQAIYGGDSKVLTLQPLGEDTIYQYIAPMTPMRPGTYTIHLSGKVGSTIFNNDVQPEEVQTADTVEFPSGQLADTGGSSSGLNFGLGITGIILGAVGTLFGFIALSRKKSRKG